MRLKKRKKSNRFRGSRMHGRAAKKTHGSGNRGGFGNAGMGKHASHKKTLALKLYGKNYFGKEGLKAKRNKLIGINLSDLPKAPKSNELIIKGYKILGDGEAEKGIISKASGFSQKAKEKIEKIGGKAIVIGGKKSGKEKTG